MRRRKKEVSVEQKTSSFRLSSQHFIQQIEGAIIKLTQCLAVEHQVQPDPEAKNIARKMVQTRVNQLLNDEEIEGIRLFRQALKDNYSGGGDPKELAQAAYEVLKMMGLDDV